MLPRLSGVLSWILPALLVATGVVGYVRLRVAGAAGGPAVEARGDFWVVSSRKERTMEVQPPSAGLLLKPGESFRLLEDEGDALRFEKIALRLERAGGQSGCVRLDFREHGAASYRATIVPGSTVIADLAFITRGRRAEALAEAERDGLIASGAERFEIALLLDGPSLAIAVEGVLALEATDPRCGEGRVSVWADGVRIRGVTVTGRRRDDGGAWSAFRLEEDFARFAGASCLGAVVRSLAVALGVLLLSGLYLRSLCLGRPPAANLIRATLVLLSPAALVLFRSLFLALSPPFIGVAAIAGALLGAFPALFVLRGDMRIPVRAGAAGRLRSVLVILLVSAPAVWLAGAAEVGAVATPLCATRASLADLSSAAFRLESPVALDAANAIVADGPFRSRHPDRVALLQRLGAPESARRRSLPHAVRLAGLHPWDRPGDRDANGGEPWGGADAEALCPLRALQGRLARALGGHRG